MASERPAYSGEYGACVKCGANTTGDKSAPDGRGYRSVPMGTEYRRYGQFGDAEIFGQGEDPHLRRVCGRCDYVWEEACADA